MAKFLSDISLEQANDLQFKTAAGANAGKIEQDGDDLVLSNAVGDVLLGDGISDVYIGNGVDPVDILFEVSGSISAESGATLTLGGSGGTLNLESPNINGNFSIGATSINNKLTFTTANGYILFDHEPSGDTGEYTTEVPLLKVDRAGGEYTILSRISEYGGIQLGHDDGVFITGGESGDMVKSNMNMSAEVVGFAAEGGFYGWGWPYNMQSPYNTWASRYEFRFRTDHHNTAASDPAADSLATNGLYIGQGTSTQFIDMSRNLKNIGTITASGKIQGAELEGTSLDINGDGDISGTLTANVVNMSGGDVNGNLYADRYFQAATGVPTNNLGSPTVTEMALFESQFKPQTTLANSYDNLDDLTFWSQATNGAGWTEVTSYSDDIKRKFLRTNNSSVIIPNDTYAFRVEFVAHNYTYANAMYMYWSSQSHNSPVHVWKRRCSDSARIEHTDSATTISSWPGHGYLPFDNIAWDEASSSASKFNAIRIEFTPNWIAYSGSGTDYSDRDILLYGMQIWGGYPSGKRTVHNYDQDGKLDLFKIL